MKMIKDIFKNGGFITSRFFKQEENNPKGKKHRNAGTNGKGKYVDKNK